MEKIQVADLLEKIKRLYPNFNINKEVVDAWAYILKNANYELTVNRLMEHYQSSKFPPHVSEIKVMNEINPAAIQYQMIQEEIQRNKQQAKDPEKQKLIDANLKKIRGALIDE